MVKKLGFGKKELKELYATYGTLNLYSSGNFDPNTRNLTTGATHVGHHCDRCDKPMSRSCFENLHYGFCTEFVTRGGKRERCGERMCMRSDGCGTHRRVHGCNAPLYLAAEGEHVDIEEFADKSPKNLVSEQNDSSHDKAAELATVDAAAEAYIAEHGYLPANFHGDYFKQRAKEVAYARAEQSLVPQGSLTESQNLTKSKPVDGKRSKRRSVILDGDGRRDSVQHLNATRDGSTVQLKGKNRHAPKNAFAPKGAKAEKPMEIPRLSEDVEEAPDTKKDRATTFAVKVLGKMGSIPE